MEYLCKNFEIKKSTHDMKIFFRDKDDGLINRYDIVLGLGFMVYELQDNSLEYNGNTYKIENMTPYDILFRLNRIVVARIFEKPHINFRTMKIYDNFIYDKKTDNISFYNKDVNEYTTKNIKGITYFKHIDVLLLNDDGENKIIWIKNKNIIEIIETEFSKIGSLKWFKGVTEIKEKKHNLGD